MADDIAYLTATELLDHYRRRTLSPLEVVEAALTRLERYDPVLNAFQLLDAEGARRSARESEARWARGEPMGALDGVPVTIKDIVLTKGWPTRFGSKTVDPDQPWDEDAPCVARLREAGAIFLGKTTTPEFGWKGMTDSPLAGITRNPWNTGHTPGGSSGGAGASLAAGIGALAYGNDGGGSIRIPSSYCGIFGIKPTFARVPHYPQEGPFCTVVSGGPMTRCVQDAALMLNVLVQPDSRDAYSLPPTDRDYRIGLEDGVRGLRLAFSPNLGGARVDEEVLSLVRAGVERFAELGARVDEVGPVIEPLRPAFEDLWLAGFADRLRAVPQEKRGLLDPGFRALAEHGLEVTMERFSAATTARSQLIARLNAFHETYDLLLTPTMPTPPPTVETAYHTPEFDRWEHGVPFTLPFNLTGQPAASIPCGLTESGLPVGLQIVGPRFGEHLVLRASRGFETLLPLFQPSPQFIARLEEIGRSA
jgi:aspartyl-tRNA(Asn)/glutamyl-tRNA(Gln) amidotransferase subunit A